MTGQSFDSNRRGGNFWHLLIPSFGAMLVLTAIGKAVTDSAAGGGLLEPVLDLFLLSVPGLVMIYIGYWLLSTTIEARDYRRIVAWTVGGVVVMGIVLWLRVVHPGVDVQFTFGTQAVLLSIGSIAGLGIGVNNAQARSHAKALRAQNEQLRRTEDQLETAVSELEASNERLEQFAYAASHDLQEPLRMVTSYLQLIEKRYGEELDEECIEFIDFAVDGADRMRNMIDGLLEYSRVETGGDSMDSVDLESVLDDVLTNLQFKIEAADATITSEPLPTVRGDASQLQQVFQNLVSNAIEYSGDAPPRINVSATRDGETWTIAVRDEGVGIDAEHTDRVFEIFERLHSADERDGTGLGLALCKRIVERHDGEIWVDSTKGEGSTFSFTLRESTTVPETTTPVAEADARSVDEAADGPRTGQT